MLDLDTFLTTLYVLADDAIKSLAEEPSRPGPKSSLSSSEVATLAMAAQWKRSRANEPSYAMRIVICEPPFLACLNVRS